MSDETNHTRQQRLASIYAYALADLNRDPDRKQDAVFYAGGWGLLLIAFGVIDKALPEGLRLLLTGVCLMGFGWAIYHYVTVCQVSKPWRVKMLSALVGYEPVDEKHFDQWLNHEIEAGLSSEAVLAWVVKERQRVAALRVASKAVYPISEQYCVDTLRRRAENAQ